MLSETEKRTLYDAILTKFKDFEQIDSKFIDRLYDVLSRKTIVKFEGLEIEVNMEGINPYYYFLGKITDLADYYLCKRARNNEDLELQIMINHEKTIDFVCRKLKVKSSDEKITTAYSEAIKSYDGSISLDTHITRTLMQVIKKKYVVEKSNVKFPIPTENKKSDSKIQVVESASTENKIDVPKVENKVEELKVDKDLSILDQCGLITKNVLPLGDKDVYVDLFRYFDIASKIDATLNINYSKYLCLRFGYLDDKCYSLLQISALLNITMPEVIQYEKFTVVLIQQNITNEISSCMLTLPKL